MNMRVSDEFGQYFVRLPLTKAAKIVHGNALRVDWADVVPKEQLSFILGNPPFVGKSLQNAAQREDMDLTFMGVESGGLLDYVTAWYLKAAKLIKGAPIKVAFVSTNSVVQGEQVGILWGELFSRQQVKIHFAHTTFKWSNEARGNAAVYCVIIGFANFDTDEKRLFTYEDISGEPHEKTVKNLNPYLVEGKDLVLLSRKKPISSVPPIINGSKPVDGGNLIFTDAEKNEFLRIEPEAEKLFKVFAGADDFINGKTRWCLWLKDFPPNELRKFPKVLERVEAVKNLRLKSQKEYTRKAALTPTLFEQIRQPQSDYILIPRHSSENRLYLPVGFLSKEVIVADSATFIPNATLYHFGMIASKMHMAWVKYTCGRIKSDFRYSNSIVYNNFPFPLTPTDTQKKKVEEAAQGVLDARAKYPGSSLADLYDPVTMPPDLVRAHQALDKAVDLCYRPQAFPNELGRIEFLFGLYEQYTAPMFGGTGKKGK